MVLNHLYFWDLHSEKYLQDKAGLTPLHLATSLCKFETFVLQFVLYFVFFSVAINTIPTASMIGRYNFEVSLLQFVGIVNTHSKHQLVSFLQMVGIFNTYDL